MNMTLETPEGPVLFLTPENVQAAFPSWKVSFSPSNQKATAWRRTLKGRVKLKGTLPRVARSLFAETEKRFGGIK